MLTLYLLNNNTLMKNLVTIIIFSLSFSYYEIGDTISIVDQQVPHEICYGDYENDFYMVGDANHHLNGGRKKITIMKLSAAW